MTTHFQSPTAVTSREAEVPSASFDNGANLASSCAPAIGVNVGVPNLAGAPEQFTLLDQDTDPRTPQNSQHIGGNGLGDGAAGKGVEPVSVTENSVNGDGSTTGAESATLSTLSEGWKGV